MILIVGLGNPGKKYQKTRHNIGYRAIDAFPQKAGFAIEKTNTFMNDSGKAVKSLIRLNYPMVELRRIYKNLFVIHDDIDIPIGEFKISFGRGSAGHKGVESIIKELGTKDFWRVRMGICPPSGKPKNVEKFVLQNFTSKEEKIIKDVIKDAILKMLRDPIS